MATLLNETHPNTIAKQLTGRDYVSYSALSTYMSCPLRYAFRYIERLPEETVSASLLFGGGIHAALEHWYRQAMHSRPKPTHNDLLATFWQSWNERSDSIEIRFGKNEDIHTIGDLAERILRAFRRSELAVVKGRILGIEQELRSEFAEGVPDLLARLDLVVETDDALVITDFKTSRGRWSATQAEDSAEQLLIYGELAQRLAPCKSLRLEYAVITKTKRPVVERHAVSTSAQRIARTRQIVQRVWQAIESGVFYPAPNSINCPTCTFRERCQAWTG